MRSETVVEFEHLDNGYVFQTLFEMFLDLFVGIDEGLIKVELIKFFFSKLGYNVSIKFSETFPEESYYVLKNMNTSTISLNLSHPLSIMEMALHSGVEVEDDHIRVDREYLKNVFGLIFFNGEYLRVSFISN